MWFTHLVELTRQLLGKNLHFILSDRFDFHMTNNQSIAVYTFASRILISFSEDIHESHSNYIYIYIIFKLLSINWRRTKSKKNAKYSVGLGFENSIHLIKYWIKDLNCLSVDTTINFCIIIIIIIIITHHLPDPSLSFIAFGRSSGSHPVSALGCCM